MINFNTASFKAYDIRGRIPDELNEEISYRIGRAFAEYLKPSSVVVGRDVRLTSESFCTALSRGLTDGGANVIDIGLCGTEEIYFATSHLDADGGIMVTASHNPMDYNGMKLVKKDSRPISGDTGLNKIKELVASATFDKTQSTGVVRSHDIKPDYIKHLLTYINIDKLKPFKIVVNAGNGCVGPAIDAIEEYLPFEFIKVYHEPDGTFPNGIPNPLLPENRLATEEAVIKHNANIGIAWDGDFDRCFFFDEKGKFIEGYYIVGLLAEALLKKFPNEKIIHDPRLTWNTIEQVEQAGGMPVMSKTGHAFIKERMRQEDAIYGGEMSAHHYFRDFAYCDSGMVPWLLVLALMSEDGQKLSELVKEREQLFPVSGEINVKLADPDKTIKEIELKYSPNALEVDYTDGVSIEFEDWRFNLRKSNTEPLVRLNVESRGNYKLMEEKRDELLEMLKR